MAVLIKPDGRTQVVLPKNSNKGFTLPELYSLLDCDMVQMVPLLNDQEMWCDEEAKLKDVLPQFNPIATAMLQKAGGIPGDKVLGNVLICSLGEVL